MTVWTWVLPQTVLALHDEQIAEHGGISGTRDQGLLDSALNRPINRASYEEPTLAELAAAYGYGLARNHPFLDGNKRTAFVVTELFLMLNGYSLEADDADCLMTFLALAEGTVSEAELRIWLDERISAIT